MIFHRFTTFALALLFFAAPATVFAADPAPANGFTDAQKTQIEEVVRQLLTSKEPDLVMKAAQEYQRKQADEENKKAKEGIVKNKDKLFNDPKDPFLGNPKGDVVVVEFFDFNCGYCKKVLEPLQQLVKEDKNVKVILKEYPILSDSSKTAAKAALAAHKQGKYVEMHVALLQSKGGLGDDSIMEIAANTGLDKAKLKKDMEDPEIASQIAKSQDLGKEVGAHGTPAFIIGETLIPGAMSLSEFKEHVAKARTAKN